jgi:hypothetical protein
MRNVLLGWLTPAVLLMAPAGAFAASCGVTKPDARDAVALSPDFYKVVIDNDQIRIIEETIPAGAKEPTHSHVWPAIVIEDTQRPGEIPAVRNFKSVWEPATKKSKGAAPGKDGYHALRVELKKGDCEPVKNPPLPPSDGVVIHDPKIVVPFENAWVRVLEIEVKPGDAEPPHTHTWPSVVYYYRLPSSRRGTTDGKPPVDRLELTKPQITFENFAADMHTLLNTGNYLYQAHRIEIKPVTDQPAKK